MYRSLCEQGSLTEYSPYASHPLWDYRPSSLSFSFGPPQMPFPDRHDHGRELHNIDSLPLHFRTRTTNATFLERVEIEPFVLVPTAPELVQQQHAAAAEYVSDPASSNTTLTVPAKTKSRDMHAEYRLPWRRPVEPTARAFE
jgi:hypothetical protein